MKTGMYSVFRTVVLFLATPPIAGAHEAQSPENGNPTPGEAYPAYYDEHFTGTEADGWDPALQYAWSRLGAARTCGIDYPGELIVDRLVARFGQNRLTHTRVGIEFHHQQSHAHPGFCTHERVTEIEAAIPAFAAGDFPDED